MLGLCIEEQRLLMMAELLEKVLDPGKVNIKTLKVTYNSLVIVKRLYKSLHLIYKCHAMQCLLLSIDFGLHSL